MKAHGPTSDLLRLIWVRLSIDGIPMMIDFLTGDVYEAVRLNTITTVVGILAILALALWRKPFSR